MKDKILHKSETIIYFTLTIAALFYIVFQIVDLIFQFISAVGIYSFGQSETVEEHIFSSVVIVFFNILISLEILETFKENESVLHKAKIILLIAITAMTRKIITMDLKKIDYLTDFGVAALILSLAVGYYFLSKSKGKMDA